MSFPLPYFKVWLRAILLLALCGSLAACGFQPIKQATPYAEQQTSQIFVTGLTDRSGQLLRNAMVTRLSPAGEPTDPKFFLDIDLKTRTKGVATSRKTMEFTAKYSLKRSGTQAKLTSGTIVDEIAFNMGGNTKVDLYPEQAAVKRGVERTADRLEQALIVFLVTQYKGREILDEML